MASLGPIKRTLGFINDHTDLVIQACDRHKINYGQILEGMAYSCVEAYASDEKTFDKLVQSMKICNIEVTVTENRVVGVL